MLKRSVKKTSIERGDIYLADLDPTKGSEQAGTRPVLVFQHNSLNKVGNTIVVIPFTTNTGAARLPSCVLVSSGEGGLRYDSVALCHQIRVLDKAGLRDRWGKLPQARLDEIEHTVAFTLGMREKP
jgi:mRNA interferase MazF